MTRFWMPCRMLVFLCAVSLWSLSPGLLRAESDDEAKAEATETDNGEQADEKPVELDGVLLAVEASPVMVDPKEWSQLTVVEAVEHGQEVERGELLVRLEMDDYEKALRDLERDVATDELALHEAHVKLGLAKRSHQLAMQAAERADRTATEDLKEFVTSGRQNRVESLERSVKSARDRLAYQEEELRQLEKMYEADDLTEETEEIILKRTRDAVDSARYSLERTLDSQRTGNTFDIPRSQVQLETAVQQATIALEEARGTAPQKVRKQELDFAKQEDALQRKREKLNRLRADGDVLRITAPHEGVIYFGNSQKGEWSDVGSVKSMLKPGGSLKTKSVIMNVVQLRPLQVRVMVPESALQHVQVGVKAELQATAFPDQKLSGEVLELSSIPISDGQFSATLSVDADEIHERIVPGMKAKVVITPDSDD